MPEISYKFRDKNNERPLQATCAYCLENSTFRIISIDGVNHVSCVRCLKYCRYYKRFKVAQHPIVLPIHLSKKMLVLRAFKRVKRWVLGDHVYGYFGRKRSKAKW